MLSFEMGNGDINYYESFLFPLNRSDPGVGTIDMSFIA